MIQQIPPYRLCGKSKKIPLYLPPMSATRMILGFRDRILAGGRIGKTMIGAGLMVFGLLIMSGLDKRIESQLVAISPAWFTELTTRY